MHIVHIIMRTIITTHVIIIMKSYHYNNAYYYNYADCAYYLINNDNQ